MIGNYLKIAFRTLFRHRLFSFINVFGLALSMSVCMMVILRVKDQLDYDRFHPDGDRTYRIITKVSEKNREDYHLASTPVILNQLLGTNSSVEKYVSVYAAMHSDGSYGEKTVKMNGAFTDPAFFRVFGFEFFSGSAEALNKPNTLVLSEEAATRLFRDEDPVGKMITLDKLGSYLVSGVLKKPAGKSHLLFDTYVSSATIPLLQKNNLLSAELVPWNAFQPNYTYVVIKKGTSTKLLKDYLAGISSDLNHFSEDKQYALELQKLDDITPGTIQMYNDISNGTGWPKLWVELGIALLILFAGCFNYTNLTIARALSRAKEVGIRKMAGARRYQVFFQYVTESVCIALSAFVLGLLILAFILKYQPFNDGYQFMPEVQIDAKVFLIFLLFSIGTGILAGSLPAWVLSSFQPVEVLKNIRTRKLFGNITLQKSLIVFQFSLSLIILIFLTAFYSQFSYLAKVHTGFTADHILVVPLDGGDPALLAAKFNSISGVKETGAVSGNFGRHATGRSVVSLSKEDKAPIRMNHYFGDSALVSMMGLKIVAGNDFRGLVASSKEQYVLINEKAVQSLSLGTNAQAVGQIIHLDDTTDVMIRGVLKDFYYQGAGNEIYPLLIRQRQDAYAYMNVWTEPGSGEDLVKRVEAAWKEVYPFKLFHPAWYKKEIEAANDQAASISLLGFLGLITVTIGSLGLLGLVVYTVETRRKEISIRKVIGASVRELVKLLSRSYIKLLIIAGLIALPLGYILSRLFLQNFANRTPFGIVHLLLCFAFLLGIGLITIVSQTFKAASSNPANNLRIE